MKTAKQEALAIVHKLWKAHMADCPLISCETPLALARVGDLIKHEWKEDEL